MVVTAAKAAAVDIVATAGAAEAVATARVAIVADHEVIVDVHRAIRAAITSTAARAHRSDDQDHHTA